MAAYGTTGTYTGAFTGDDAQFTGAKPYVEQDKAARSTAIFQGVAGLIQSAGDFWQRIKYNVKPVPGGYGESNAYWGGGVSYVPGASGEPYKATISGGVSPMIVIAIVAIVLLLVLKK